MMVHRGFWTVVTPLLLVAAAITGGTMAQQVGPGPDVCHVLDPNDALANGHATPVRVTVGGNEVVGGANLVRASSSQVGPGNAEDHKARVPVNVPMPGGTGHIVNAKVIAASSVSNVKPVGDLSSDQRSTAEVANVSLLDGRIKANVVKANAHIRTSQTMADVTGNLTSHVQVSVLGNVHDVHAPNTKIPLDTLPGNPFGAGSWIKVHERIDIGIFPHDDEPWYIGEQTIRMLHVRVTAVDGTPVPAIDIVISEAYAYAQTPTPYCVGIQGINAEATAVKLKNSTAFWKPSIIVGQTKVAHTGGWAEQNWSDVRVVGGAHVLTVGAINSRAHGVVDPGVVSKSTAVTKLTNVCLLSENRENDNVDEDDCIIRAGLIRSESNSRAWEDVPNSTDGPDYDTSSWGSAYIADVVILGEDLCEALGIATIDNRGTADPGDDWKSACKPPKGYSRQIGGLTVYLNERQRDFDPEGHTEYVVRVLRVEGEVNGQPLSLTLGRTYTEADFGASDDCTPTITSPCKM